ncbi:MAG: cation transporter [Myxococcales bacterium]|nr:cation transporter [Myxococcales bacterium]
MRNALVSLAVSLLVLGIKLGAWWVSGSIALLSDALESIVNVATAALATAMIRLADKPPDARHPYGHGKAEYFSAVAEGALILVAAGSIAFSSIRALTHSPPPLAVDTGLVLALLATAANGCLAWQLSRAGRRLDSPALVATARHIYSDVVTSVAVVAGIGLAAATDLWLLDPLIALAVAVNIVVVGLRTLVHSIGGLMDEALPERSLAKIREIIKHHMGEAIEAHALRARQAGRRAFVGFHLVVPADMTVAVAHEICDHLEEAIMAAIPGALVTVHLEPPHKAKCPDAAQKEVFDLTGPMAPPPTQDDGAG